MNQPQLESRPLHCAQSITLLVLWALFEVGCGPSDQLPPEVQQQLVTNDAELKLDAQPAPSTGENLVPDPVVPVQCEVNEAEWIQPDQLPWTYSEVQYAGNTRIGYSTITVDRSVLTELKQLRILRQDVIDRAVDGSTAAQRNVTLEIFEKPTGAMASFRFTSTIEGENELFVEGRVVFEILELTKQVGQGELIHSRIPYIREHWGPFGIQSLLMRSPMKKDEVRSAQIFIPQLAEYVTVIFEAKSTALTPLAQGGSQELLQIDLTIGTPESGMLTTLFVDQQGVIKKSITRSGQSMVAMQVPLDAVQRIADQSQFARGIARRPPVTGDLDSLPRAQSAKILVDAEDVDPYDIMLSYPRQLSKSINPYRCELTISRLDQTQQGQNDPKSAQDLSLLESSALIPTDKDLTKNLAAELLQGQSTTTPAETVEALRTALHRKWKLQPITPQIASTLVSARDLTGSCIEVAHVLAALLRHQRIPTQVICGLKIAPATSDAQFHVWNQAWVDGRWMDVDASMAEPIGLLHIGMSTTIGSGHNPYSHFLTVLNKIAELREVRVASAAAP